MKFKKLTLGVLATLGLAAGMVSAQDDDAERKALAERLKPVGELCLTSGDCGGAAPAPATTSADGGKSGEEIYGGVCMACHDTGAAGAPKRGDANAWGPRLEKGVETLYDHAINGFNAMPARGGSPSLSDAEVKKAVNYTIEPVYDGELPEVGGDAEGGGQQASSQPSGEQGGAAQVAAAGSDIDAAGIYDSVCMACHATGVAGAPKREDAEAWAPRLEKGVETLYDHAINGFNTMPAKGGKPSLSDAEVKATVNYLIEPVYDGDLPAAGGGATETADQDNEAAGAEATQTSQPAAAPADTDPTTQGDGGGQDSAASQSGAQEVAAGSDLPGADKIGTCVACHGPEGHGTAPMYPRLAGQNATYMENALKAYRDGKRGGGMSSVMTPMAASLSDEDIKDLAEYYSQQTP